MFFLECWINAGVAAVYVCFVCPQVVPLLLLILILHVERTGRTFRPQGVV